MVTDETGTFHIAQLPEGGYTLSISFIGYKTIEKPFTLSNRYRESISGTCYLQRGQPIARRSQGHRPTFPNEIRYR